MIRAELKGLDEAYDNIEWVKDNWKELQSYALKRMAQYFVDLMGIEPTFIHFVRIDAGGTVWHGVSLEPEPFEMEVTEDLKLEKSYLFYLLPGVEAGSDVEKLVGGNPYTASTLPVAPDKEEAIYLLRDSTPDEVNAARLENLGYFVSNNIDPVSVESDIPVQEDLEYNVSRAEYQIGDSGKEAAWRPAFKKLTNKVLPLIMEEVKMAMIEGDIDSQHLPEFEDRSKEWLDNNEDFMLLVSG